MRVLNMHCRLIFALLCGATSACATAPSRQAPELLEACNAPTHATTLAAASRRSTEARAYWINDSRIAWPGATNGGQFALHRSSRASLNLSVGLQVTNSDERIALQIDSTPLPATVAERFRFIGAAVQLSLLPADTARVNELLRDQLLLVQESATGAVISATALQIPGALDARYATAASVPDLGATVRRESSDLALWAPTARNVSVCLFPNASANATELFPLQRNEATGTWRTTINHDVGGQAYLYLVDVFVPGAGFVRNRVTDPYSVALTANSARSVLLDLEDSLAKPAGWDTYQRPAPLDAPTDLSVYELHVRDFSIADTSVRTDWRGKYLAFSEPNSAGMQHLRLLRGAGITDVHLLPVFDLATVPEVGCISPAIPDAPPDSDAQQAAIMAVASQDCFNWGYDPFHFSAPEGSFALSPDDAAARTREFRSMVMALHANGLRVGMDVVYNHTSASGQDPRSVLDRIVPGYYHRLNAGGAVERSTCCDNTATEHAMMAKLMIESAVLWTSAHHIDSFRFDLMGHQPKEAMLRLQRAVDSAAGQRVALIGEGWDFGEVANGARFVQASQLSLGGSGIATFTDRARDALRGGGCCDSGEGLVRNQGLLNGLHYAPNARNADADQRAALFRSADLARIGLAGTLRDAELRGADDVQRAMSAFDYAGGPAGYAHEPSEVVNYVENHDNLTLFDINALRLPRETSREQRARAQVVGIAFTALAQGVAYYHAGVEILRSKSLDRDSYDSGDWFNRLDFTYTGNGFGAGLPPSNRNVDDWALLAPVLRDSSIAPSASHIRFTRDAALDLMRIRASSTLFRMRSAADIRERLRFHNTGSSQDPTVMAVHLNGDGYAGAAFGEILYFINVAPDARTLQIAQEASKSYALHPVHLSAQATDSTARDARYDPATGRFTVPARTAVVFVVP